RVWSFRVNRSTEGAVAGGGACHTNRAVGRAERMTMTVAQQVDSGAIAGSAQAPAAVKASWWEHAAPYRYGFVVVLLIVWEMVAPFISPIFFTSPSKIAIAFYETTVSGELPYFLAQSLEVMVYGLVTAIVVGI